MSALKGAHFDAVLGEVSVCMCVYVCVCVCVRACVALWLTFINHPPLSMDCMRSQLSDVCAWPLADASDMNVHIDCRLLTIHHSFGQ